MTAYRARQHLRYSAPQLFDLVANVESYPEFLPWVVASRIRSRKDRSLLVEMTLSMGPLRKQFSSVGVLDPPQRIDITSSDPIFERFSQHWTFVPVDGGTDVEYRLDCQLRSRMLQMVMSASIAERAAATMAAFKRRAQKLYGGQA